MLWFCQAEKTKQLQIQTITIKDTLHLYPFAWSLMNRRNFNLKLTVTKVKLFINIPGSINRQTLLAVDCASITCTLFTYSREVYHVTQYKIGQNLFCFMLKLHVDINNLYDTYIIYLCSHFVTFYSSLHIINFIKWQIPFLRGLCLTLSLNYQCLSPLITTKAFSPLHYTLRYPYFYLFSVFLFSVFLLCAAIKYHFPKFGGKQERGVTWRYIYVYL